MLLKDKFCLETILESIQKIEKYVSKYSDSESFFDTVDYEASIMNFIIIAEMTEKISKEIKSNNSQVNWRNIKGFRNIASHNYFGLDLDEVWEIIHNFLPKLESEIHQILEDIQS